MISEKLNEQLNQQMEAEFYSAYFYLSMSAWFKSKSLNGFANWFHVQSKEERDHAALIMDYLIKVGAKVEFLPIEAPEQQYEGPLDICEKTLKHEKLVTSLIYNLMDTAQAEHDYKTIQFLQWFVNEQVEEEENATEIIEKIKMADNTEGGILFIDAELSSRKYNPIKNAD